MPTSKLAVFFALMLLPSPTLACPKGWSSNFLGVCQPNIGGDVGAAWEKAKKEIANFEKDIRVLIETGKCGGDICDAFAAAVEFVEADIADIGPTFDRARERLEEGKPLDAVWHFTTDPLQNSSDNAAAAAQRSRLLAATAQVAASAYGGPAGAAAFTAWLTYETTGDIADAIRAG